MYHDCILYFVSVSVSCKDLPYPRWSSMRAAPEALLSRSGGLATKSLIGAASMLALSSEVTVCSELSSPYRGFALEQDTLVLFRHSNYDLKLSQGYWMVKQWLLEAREHLEVPERSGSGRSSS